MKSNVKKLTYTALFAALIFLATAVFPITLPFGYVNMGDAFVLLGAAFLGPAGGAVSAGVGAGLADVFLGYGIYAPATFVIKALMAVVYCAVAGVWNATNNSRLKSVIGALCAEAVMVLGYFAYESCLYGVGGALSTVVGNLLQAGFAMVAFSILVNVFGTLAKKLFSFVYVLK